MGATPVGIDDGAMNDNPHPPTDPAGDPTEEERVDAADPVTGAETETTELDDIVGFDETDDDIPVLDIDTTVDEEDDALTSEDEPVLVGVGVPDSAAMTGEERPVGGIRPPQPPSDHAGPSGSGLGDGTGPTPGGPMPAPPQRRLRRVRSGTSHDGRTSKLGGVTTGLGRYLGVDAAYLRAGFILLVFFNGFGLLAYLAAWALIPGEDDPRPQPVVPTRSVAGLVIGLAAAIGALATIADPFSIDITDLILPLGLIGAGVWFLDRRPDLDPVSPATAPTVDHLGGPHGPVTPPPPTAATATGFAETSSHWATPPVTTRPSGPPITAITFAATAALLGLTVLLDSFDAIDPSEVVYAGVLCLGFGGGLLASALIKGARSGLLIGLSLLSLLTLGLVSISGPIVFGGIGERTETVVGVIDDDDFRWGIGEYELDLRAADVARLREVEVEQGIGELVIRVPDDVLVQVEADVSGGVINLFGRTTEGSNIDDSIVIDPSGERVGRAAVAEAVANGEPVLVIESTLRFGEMRVTR